MRSCNPPFRGSMSRMGFDYNLTNYTLSNLNFGISLEVHPSGKVRILQVQWILWNYSLIGHLAAVILLQRWNGSPQSSLQARLSFMLGVAQKSFTNKCSRTAHEPFANTQPKHCAHGLGSSLWRDEHTAIQGLQSTTQDIPSGPGKGLLLVKQKGQWDAWGTAVLWTSGSLATSLRFEISGGGVACMSGDSTPWKADPDGIEPMTTQDLGTQKGRRVMYEVVQQSHMNRRSCKHRRARIFEVELRSTCWKPTSLFKSLTEYDHIALFYYYLYVLRTTCIASLENIC